MKKRAFTLVEVLVSSLSVSLILTVCLALMRTSSVTLTGEFINADNRSAVEENVSYMTREIQSAESIRISNGGKEMSIRKVGTDEGADGNNYTIKYEIRDGSPCGGLYITSGGSSEKKLMDVDYNDSSFSNNKDSIEIGFNSDNVTMSGSNITIPKTRYIKHFSRLGAANTRLNISRLKIPSNCYLVIFDNHELDNLGGLRALYDNLRVMSLGDGNNRVVTGYAESSNPGDTHYTYSTAEIARYTGCDLSNVQVSLGSDDIVIMFVSNVAEECIFNIDSMSFDSANGIGDNTVNVNIKMVKDPRNQPLTYTDFKLSVSSRNSECEVQ